MSKQLSISATLSVLAMALFAMAYGPSAHTPAAQAATSPIVLLAAQ